MSFKEYNPNQTFPGIIGRTIDLSSPAWPEPLRAKKGSPNILFIVLDDAGFGQLGCYGSPIETPNIDSLAQNGLRYNNMHTAALCSPTRSCILTGRNHHSNSMAGVIEISTGYPGYNGNIPFENGMLSEILVQNGYNTYALGKWHLTPSDQLSAAGPYNRWPLGRGFERYYGFMGGDTHQYYPQLIYDNHGVEPSKTPQEGYHLTSDLVEIAKAFIADSKQVDPDKPFFLYFCPGAVHAPHQVPKEWADKYKGKFDDGWGDYREKVFARQKELGIVPQDTELSRHDPDVQRWEDLSGDEKKLYSRMMEVFAGFFSHTDHYIGKLLGFLKEIGEFENTLIMLISDNGASAEGGPHGSVNENKFFNNVPDDLEQNLKSINELGGPEHFNHYPWGWAWAGNAPFRRWKRETYRGGTSDPFIVHWPKGIKAKGEIRDQYCHAIDMMPTVLDALGITPPETIRGVIQSPIQGVSFAASFTDPGVKSRHRVQYFEMMGHRALYHEGWKAVCPWPGPSFKEAGRSFGERVPFETLIKLDEKGWELYHVEKDFAENHNVASQHPARLLELVTQWYVEAGKYDVLPLDGRLQSRMTEERPQLSKTRSSYTYYPGTQPVPQSAAAKLLNRSYSITADVEIPEEGAQGVLISAGGVDGGYSMYVKDNKLNYDYNYVAARHFHLESDQPVPEGKHRLRFEFETTGKPDIPGGKGAPGIGKLYIDGRNVGRLELPLTTPIILGLGGGIVCGADTGAPVTDAYTPPFGFTGKLRKVIVDVSGKLFEDKEAQIREVMARQ